MKIIFLRERCARSRCNIKETPEEILELINNQFLAKKLESELYGEFNENGNPYNPMG